MINGKEPRKMDEGVDLQPLKNILHEKHSFVGKN